MRPEVQNVSLRRQRGTYDSTMYSKVRLTNNEWQKINSNWIHKRDPDNFI